jgi:hypothetical protein
MDAKHFLRHLGQERRLGQVAAKQVVEHWNIGAVRIDEWTRHTIGVQTRGDVGAVRGRDLGLRSALPSSHGPTRRRNGLGGARHAGTVDSEDATLRRGQLPWL